MKDINVENKEKLMNLLLNLWPELWRVASTVESQGNLTPYDIELFADALYGISRIRDGSGSGAVVMKLRDGVVIDVDIHERRVSKYSEERNVGIKR